MRFDGGLAYNETGYLVIESTREESNGSVIPHLRWTLFGIEWNQVRCPLERFVKILTC